MVNLELLKELDRKLPVGVDLNEYILQIRKEYKSELLGRIIMSPNANGNGPSFYFPDSDRVNDCVVDIKRQMHASFYYEGMPDSAILIEWYNGNDIYCTRHENFLDSDEKTIVAELERGFKEAEETINEPWSYLDDYDDYGNDD